MPIFILKVQKINFENLEIPQKLRCLKIEGINLMTAFSPCLYVLHRFRVIYFGIIHQINIARLESENNMCKGTSTDNVSMLKQHNSAYDSNLWQFP